MLATHQARSNNPDPSAGAAPWAGTPAPRHSLPAGAAGCPAPPSPCQRSCRACPRGCRRRRLRKGARRARRIGALRQVGCERAPVQAGLARSPPSCSAPPPRRAPARGANPPVFASQPHAPRCDMRSSILSASVTQRRDGCLLSSPTKPTPAGGEGGAAAGRRGGCGGGAGFARRGHECPSAGTGRQHASDVAHGPPAAHQRPSSAAGGGCGCGIAVAGRESGGPRAVPAAAAAADRRPCQPDSNTQRITANAHAPARGSEAAIGAARQVSGREDRAPLRRVHSPQLSRSLAGSNSPAAGGTSEWARRGPRRRRGRDTEVQGRVGTGAPPAGATNARALPSTRDVRIAEGRARPAGPPLAGAPTVGACRPTGVAAPIVSACTYVEGRK